MFFGLSFPIRDIVRIVTTSQVCGEEQMMYVERSG